MEEGAQEKDIISAEDKLKTIQNKWVDLIKELNSSMKNLPSLDSLLNKIYSERQNAVDYYFVLQKLLIKLSVDYKKEYARIYNDYKVSGNNGIRYNNESSLSLQIESVLSDKKKNIQMIQSHSDFMKETIKTIDNIIYGIGQKIKVYEIMNGLKP